MFSRRSPKRKRRSWIASSPALVLTLGTAWPQWASCGSSGSAESEHVNGSLHVNGDLHVNGRIFVNGEQAEHAGGEEHHDEHGQAADPHAAPGHEEAGGHGGTEHAADAAWEYEGDHGPEAWGKIDPSFALCESGQQQSPIDIDQAAPATLGPVDFLYQAIPLRLRNDGHTVVVDSPNAGWVEFSAKRYELQYISFRVPSEHRVRGRAYDMSAQLHHVSHDGEKMIVEIPYVVGTKNPAIEVMWKYFPARKGESSVHEDVVISPDVLLPPHRSYYTYIGSLSSPPCTEGVRWVVLKTPTSVSAAQVERLRRSFPVSVRPVQQLNGRTIGQGR